MGLVARMASVVLCCVFAVPAIAEAKRLPTEISLVGADSDFISAELRSPGKDCLRSRKVSLSDLGTGAVLQTTTTARDGQFSIALDNVPFGTTAVRVSVPRKGRCEQDIADVAFDAATLTGGPGDGAFQGVLSSSVDACEPGRRISLYEISSDPVFVGFNFTEASGAWTIAQASGNYQALAEPALVGGGDAYTYCRPVYSPAWSFEEPPEG